MTVNFADMNADLLDGFGEEATYIKSGGATRAITIIIDRAPPAKLGEAPDSNRPMIQVLVANSATTGILASEIDLGSDSITLPARLGKSATTFHFGKLIGQDNGMLRLEVR